MIVLTRAFMLILLLLNLAQLYCAVDSEHIEESDIQIDGAGQDGDGRFSARELAVESLSDLESRLTGLGDFDSSEGLADSSRRALQAPDGFEFPPKHQRMVLSDSCLNKVCRFWEYALSCKAFDFGVTRTCAKYLLGYSFGCSDFPRAKEIIESPSVCLQNYFAILGSLASGAFLTTLTSFSESSCERNCYQNYQNYSKEFYLDQDCYSQVYSPSSPSVPAAIPFTTLLGFFQQFRNQGCVVNPDTGYTNCYTEVQVLLAQIAMAASAGGGTPNPNQAALNFECNYFGLNSTYYDPTLAAQNNAVLGQACAGFSAAGCCAGSGIAVVVQNQVQVVLGGLAGGVDVVQAATVVPPCLLHYLNTPSACSGVNLTDMCELWSLAEQSTMTGRITLPAGNFTSSGASLTFPNMYDKADVLGMMGAITGVLSAFPGFSEQPYIFNPGYPFQVMVTDFAYYNGTDKLTPDDGTMYWPPQGDYAAATSGEFIFQLVVQNLDSDQANTLSATLASPNFAAGISVSYTGVPGYPGVTSQAVSGALNYEEQPQDTSAAPRSHSAGAGPWRWMLTAISSLSCAALLLLVQHQQLPLSSSH